MLKRDLLPLLLTLTLILTACGAPAAPDAAPGGDSGGDSGATTSEGDAAMAKDLPADAAAEQVLNLVLGGGTYSYEEPIAFHLLATGGRSQQWKTLYVTPLMYFDIDQNLKPAVFETWKSNEDNTEWTFTIDPRAVWSDGSPITATDIKKTWELMANPLSVADRSIQYIGNVVGFAEVRAEEATEIPGVEVIDDLTVHVKLTQSDAIFHWRIATSHMGPIKMDGVTIDDMDTLWKLEAEPATSGPYVLSEFDADLGTAKFVPNPNWWMEEGPYLDAITFQLLENDPQAMAAMALNGQIHAVSDPMPPAFQEQIPDWYRPIKQFGFNSHWFSTTTEPTSDPKVREALTLAVDLEQVFKAGWPEGDGIRATQMLDPDMSCYDTENSWYEYDPEAAKQALADSSYGSAENLPKIRVSPRSLSPNLIRSVEAIMEFWRQNLGIENVEFKTQTSEFGDDEPLVNLNRDDVVTRVPDGATYTWVAAHSKGPIASENMMDGYVNPEIDALLDEALSLSPEDPRRCELTQEAQKLFMGDYPGFFVGIPIATINASEQVKNFQWGPDLGMIEPWKIYIGQ